MNKDTQRTLHQEWARIQLRIDRFMRTHSRDFAANRFWARGL